MDNKAKFVEDMTSEELAATMSDKFDPVICDIEAEIAEAMKDPEFKKVWDENEPERTARRLFLRMRKNAQLTQDEVAKQLNTTRSVISRMESAQHSPTLRQLFKYADACGFTLKLMPVRKHTKAFKRGKKVLRKA